MLFALSPLFLWRVGFFKMRKITIIFLLLLLVSCKNEKSNPYIGNWYFDKIVDYDSLKTEMPKSYLERMHGNYYSFAILNDSILERKSGFFYSILDHTSYYLGTKTDYRIKDSSIQYFDKYENDWDTLKITKIKGDTMIVKGNYNAYYQLIKKTNTYFNTKKYDAIIVERSPCYGSCPFNSTYIDRKGNFCFKAYDYNTQKGNFFSKIDNETTDEFFENFDKIDIFKLKDNYSAMLTDSQTNVISFIKNGKIVKTIETYVDCPIDLEMAFTKLSYAYQKVKLNYDYDGKYIFEKKVRFGSFVFEKTKYRLMDSESFFLENEIRKGIKSNYKFTEKFELTFYEYLKEDEKSEIKKILSDGRFFKFIKNDNTSFTIDIGYNFIDKNPIIKKNRNPT